MYNQWIQSVLYLLVQASDQQNHASPVMFIAFYKDKTRVFGLNLKYIIFNLHLIIPVNTVVPVSACSVTHDGYSFFRIEWNKQQLITGTATVPGPHQGRGILSILEKKMCLLFIALNTTAMLLAQILITDSVLHL